jgi:hypothetical protein
MIVRALPIFSTTLTRDLSGVFSDTSSATTQAKRTSSGAIISGYRGELVLHSLIELSKRGGFRAGNRVGQPCCP